MTFLDAVHYYQDKKNAKSEDDRMLREEIRAELKEQHNFSEEEIRLIFREISELELAKLNPHFAEGTQVKYPNYFSYFFLLVGLVALGYSIYILQNQPADPLLQMLPYVMILGALFLIVKHGSRLFNHNKQGE